MKPEMPLPGAVESDLDVAVAVRDGTVLRVNVYRPPGDGPFPVIMSAHPYGKDRLPAHYGKGPAARCTLHWGPERDSRLLVPHVNPVAD